MLLPGAILTAAASDLAARAHNQHTTKISGTTAPGEYRAYAFLARHVRQATSPAHLILLALAHPLSDRKGGPFKTSKPNTVTLYRDKAALLDALLMAEGKAL